MTSISSLTCLFGTEDFGLAVDVIRSSKAFSTLPKIFYGPEL